MQLDRERQTEQENQYKDQQKKLREKRESLNSSDTIIGKEWSGEKKKIGFFFPQKLNFGIALLEICNQEESFKLFPANILIFKSRFY